MPDWPVAGKTGTGEVAGKRDTSWFVSYAPANRPEWVVSVVVAQGGPGASTAAPVARAVHETLRGLR
jgi:penicillin-binding protein 2